MTIEIKPTSISGQSIFVVRYPDNSKHIPELAVQMPTYLAEYFKSVAEKSGELPIGRPIKK